MKVVDMSVISEDEVKRKSTDIFQIGDVLVVTITGVHDYGAFGVITAEGGEFTTLIHRSIIKPDSADADPKRYFKNGDKVKGVVRGFDHKGNMSFSTADYFDLLPDYDEQTTTKKQPKLVNTMLYNKYTETDEEVEQIYQQIKPLLEKTLNFISTESEQNFKRLISEIGVVEFCLSLGKIAPNFNVDPGLILAERIEHDTRGCL